MLEKTLSIKNQLYLGAAIHSIVALISLVQNLRIFSERTNDFLGIFLLIILAIAFGYETKKKEKNDEYTNKIFGEIDSICLRALSWIVLAIIVFVDFPTNLSNEFIIELFKQILWLIVTVIAILRAILFSRYERKGI